MADLDFKIPQKDINAPFQSYGQLLPMDSGGQPSVGQQAITSPNQMLMMGGGQFGGGGATGNYPDYMNESKILRLTQRLSSPTRRALSSGLEKAIMSTRYQKNPNVASMMMEKALSGYGQGLSSAVSAGEREATSIEQANVGFGFEEDRIALQREQLGIQKDAADDMGDAYKIGGAVQLGLLGDMVTGGALSKTIGKGVTAAGSALFGGKAVGGAIPGLMSPITTPAITPLTTIGTGGAVTGAGSMTSAMAASPLSAAAGIGIAALVAKGGYDTIKGTRTPGPTPGAANWVDAYVGGTDAMSQSGQRFDSSTLAENPAAIKSNISQIMYGAGTGGDGYVPQELTELIQNKNQAEILSWFDKQNIGYNATQAFNGGQTTISKLIADYGKVIQAPANNIVSSLWDTAGG